MASKISINLDTSKENYLVAKCKQNDDLVLEAFIYENGLALDLTNKEIIIQALKSNNTHIVQNTGITKENNKMLSDLVRDFTRSPGTTKIEILLIEEGKQNATFSFYLEVIRSVIDSSVESSNTVTILEALENKIVEAGQAKEETEQLITSGNAATKGDVAQINASLEHMEQQTKSYTTFNQPLKKPMITFIDDDGDKDVLTKLKPLFFGKNVPCCCAIITGSLGTGRTMKRSDLKELYQNGWEFLGHGHLYDGNLLQFTNDTDLDYQLRECKKILNEDGYMVNGFVFPQNISDKRVRSFTKKYYNYSYSALGIGNLNDTMRLPRIALGSWTSNNPTINGNSEKNTLGYYKACVDYAEANNTWLTFMVHCGQVSEGHDDTQQQYLSDIIDYIKSKNIEIVTASKGYETHGNKVFTGDLDDRYFLLNENGIKTEALNYRFAKRNSILPTVGISEYENMSITSMECTQTFATANSLPDNSAGVLLTYKFTNVINEEQYNKQIYLTYINDTFYIRRALSNSTWGEWKRVNYSKDEIISFGKLVYEVNNFGASTDLITKFSNNKITIYSVFGSNTTGYPNNSAGIVQVIRGGGNGYDRQIFYPNGSNVTHVRYVKTDGTWSDWEAPIFSKKVKYNVPELIIPANSQIEHKISYSGLVVANTHISGSPCWGLTSGLLYNVMASETDKITIRLYNLTSSSITLTARDWWFVIS